MARAKTTAKPAKKAKPKPKAKPVKKPAAKKAPAKKAPAKKSPAKKSAKKAAKQLAKKPLKKAPAKAAQPTPAPPRRARRQTLEPEIISASPILPPRQILPRTAPPHPPPVRPSKAHLPPPSEIDEGWDLDPAPESSPAHPLRGQALVEKVVEKMEADGGRLGGCGIPDHPATPMLSKEILHLALPDGRPLPSSLVRFLAYDETFLGVVEGDPPRLKLRTFRAMLAEEFDEDVANIADFGALLPGLCLVVPGGTDSRRFIYFGTADEHGEYPVMVVDVDDVPFVCIAYPGLDVYLADGVLTTVLKHSYLDGFDGPYAAELSAQARRNFHGLKSLDLGGGEVEHVDGEAAAALLVTKLFSNRS